ncbi:MAG: ribose 5-phosphate isomerase B [Bacteroidales bacterium]|nr:ribose 5-phosphate isomerase B [Bacteroidales bacterium]
MNYKKVAIACDHAGYKTKEFLKEFLKSKGIDVEDFGCFSEESVDYPDFAHPMADFVEQGKADFGISICGSGNGISMTVNKHQGIRAALCWNTEIAALAKQHNNANVCSLPARFVSLKQAQEIVEAYMNAEFEGGRHLRRIEKIPVKRI